MVNVVLVELWAFGSGGALRSVDVDFAAVGAEPPTNAELDQVFYLGQNDHQPKPMRSVSVGDVIRWGEKRYVVKPLGFAEVPEGWHPPADRLGRLLDVMDWNL